MQFLFIYFWHEGEYYLMLITKDLLTDSWEEYVSTTSITSYE